MLTPKVKQLIAKARIVSFDGWENSQPAEIIAIYQQADDEGRYLGDEDLEKIASLPSHSTSGIMVARLLRNNADTIIDEARAGVLEQFPQITAPGGALYPPERAQACWRDFWHFLRCITYGVAGHNSQFTSDEGLHHMNLLYQELNVPLDAMILGLKNLKSSSLKHLETSQADLDLVSSCFDHLISKMSAFSRY